MMKRPIDRRTVIASTVGEGSARLQALVDVGDGFPPLRRGKPVPGHGASPGVSNCQDDQIGEPEAGDDGGFVSAQPVADDAGGPVVTPATARMSGRQQARQATTTPTVFSRPFILRFRTWQRSPVGRLLGRSRPR
jgi:hypothetical protein